MSDDLFAPVTSAEEPEVDHRDLSAVIALRAEPELATVAMAGRARILARAREPVTYTWEGIALPGTVVLIVGAPGEGKTTLAFLALVARASNGRARVPVLGLPVTPAPRGRFVLLIEAEHGEASTARKLVKSCEIVGVGDDALERVIVLARRDVKLGSARWLAARRMIERGQIADVFVDSLARFADGDANAERDQAATFDEVHRAIESSPDPKPTFWFIAHGRKNATGGVDDVSGSAQRAAQGDSLLYVRAERDRDGRVASSRVTFPKLREEPDNWPGMIEFSISVGDDQRWRCEIDGRSGTEVGGAIRDRIVRALEDGPKTKRQLRDELGASLRRIEEGVSELFAGRQITAGETKKNGRLWKVLQLRPRNDWRPLSDQTASAGEDR